MSVYQTYTGKWSSNSGDTTKVKSEFGAAKTAGTYRGVPLLEGSALDHQETCTEVCIALPFTVVAKAPGTPGEWTNCGIIIQWNVTKQ